MAYRLAGWHEIQQCKRAFATLPGNGPHHTLERVWYRVLGFKSLQSGGGTGLQPYARVVREDGTLQDVAFYPAKALAFETASGEIIK
jgi:hypothetical protein